MQYFAIFFLYLHAQSDSEEFVETGRIAYLAMSSHVIFFTVDVWGQVSTEE